MTSIIDDTKYAFWNSGLKGFIVSDAVMEIDRMGKGGCPGTIVPSFI